MENVLKYTSKKLRFYVNNIEYYFSIQVAIFFILHHQNYQILYHKRTTVLE